MLIKKIVIHKKLIESFKAKALLANPYEYIEAIMGLQKKDCLYVYAFDEIQIINTINSRTYKEIQYCRPEEEVEAGTKYKYFGSIHSHPGSGCDLRPSRKDISDFLNQGQQETFWEGGSEGNCLTDQIMGIMGVHRKKKVIEYGMVFYNTLMEKIDVIISENRIKK